jgi:ABC-type multidrug transport system fused ATPase/permease subunit
LRSMIAIVPQDCVLFNDTILYNIGYGGVRDPHIKQMLDSKDREDELIEFITPTAIRAQIHDFVIAKGKGYRELVGERGLKLSGGEKQRVAIARALLKKTPIMCFDEATSALDTSTEKEIQKAINEISKGSTTLMIAHRLSTVRDCDIIIVLKHGEIVEQGNHETLLQMPDGHYRKLWEKQSEQTQREIEEKLRKQQEEEEYKRALEERTQQILPVLMKKLSKEGNNDETDAINLESEDEGFI